MFAPKSSIIPGGDTTEADFVSYFVKRQKVCRVYPYLLRRLTACELGQQTLLPKHSVTCPWTHQQNLKFQNNRTVDIGQTLDENKSFFLLPSTEYWIATCWSVRVHWSWALHDWPQNLTYLNFMQAKPVNYFCFVIMQNVYLTKLQVLVLLRSQALVKNHVCSGCLLLDIPCWDNAKMYPQTLIN